MSSDMTALSVEQVFAPYARMHRKANTRSCAGVLADASHARSIRELTRTAVRGTVRTAVRCEFLSDPLRRLLTMVAIASLPTTVTTPGRAHRLAPAHRPGPGVRRPTLTVVPPHGTGAPATGRSVWSVLGVALVVAAVLLAVAYLATTPLSAPGASVAGTHVVADGDTMWSIALEHAPAGEAAGYVERLVAANGGAAVAPGDELVLPRR
jgi:LysM repeat protein